MRLHNQILDNLNKSNLAEGTIWKRISGPRVKSIDDKYEDLIRYKLIPALNDYDLDILDRPYGNSPGKQIYVGYDSDGNKVSFIFMNNYKDMVDGEKKKWTLFLKILYKGKVEDVGMIDLDSVDNLNRSFSLITQTLEDMGFNLKDGKSKEEDKPEVEDPDITNLIDYKNSLSESAFKEIIK